MKRLALGLRSWVVFTCVGAAAAIAACSSGPPNLGDSDGSIKPPNGGGSCDTPHAGCPCTTDGAQAACGTVVRQSGSYVTCSEGKTTCGGGKWGTCVGDTVYVKSTSSTTLGGLQSQDLQTTPSACTDDPCDPNCQNYVDNGTNIDAGGLGVDDSGGLTLTQADGSTCQNLQCQLAACDAGVSTTLTGRVVAGTISTYGTADPVPNVLVYVPNAPVSPFAAGVQCNTSCSAEVSGSPIVATLSGTDGTFTLKGVPVGGSIPIVIQLGRWRREVNVNVPACATTPVGDIHMPRNKNDSTPPAAANIPFTAVSTGDVDALECVLLKMGVDQAEFTKPGGGGRVEIYDGNGSNAGSGTPNEGTLVPTTATTSPLNNYDEVLFPCWGSEVIKNSNQLSNLLNYTSAGGRVFATHYSYTWLFQNGSFAGTASWAVNANSWNSRTGTVNTSFAKGQTLASWMQLLNILDISPSPPEFTVTNPRQDLSAVVSPSVNWVSDTSGGFPLHYTFDTPVGGSNQCGRVVFSDFHVANTASAGTTFPNECTSGAMAAQEKVLEFLLFDLASCGSTIPPLVPPYPNPVTYAVDYQGVCPAGKSVVWRFFDWQTVTPSDSNIVFNAATADTQADLATATPVVYLGTASGGPITSWVGTDVSGALAPTPSQDFVRVTITFNPSSDHYYAPTLTAWRQNYDCIDSQ
jgi:hypothetical protein